VLEAKKLLKEYRNDARLGILAWSLGKLGHWNLLVDLSEEVEDIESSNKRTTMSAWDFLPRRSVHSRYGVSTDPNMRFSLRVHPRIELYSAST
jgi:hypothetical protein